MANTQLNQVGGECKQSKWVVSTAKDFFLFFFLVANTNLNHWTKRVASTRAITLDSRDFPGPFPIKTDPLTRVGKLFYNLCVLACIFSKIFLSFFLFFLGGDDPT